MHAPNEASGIASTIVQVKPYTSRLSQPIALWGPPGYRIHLYPEPRETGVAQRDKIIHEMATRTILSYLFNLGNEGRATEHVVAAQVERGGRYLDR